MSDRTPQSEVLEIFRNAGALLHDDHFVYVSGDHGSGWIAKDLLFPDTTAPARLGRLLADRVRVLGWSPALVCGPATGGLVMSQWVAHALGARSVFTEHDPLEHPVAAAGAPAEGTFVLRRGFDELVRGQQVLAVDDIVNTGHSLRQTLVALRRAGAQVLGAATWVTRGNVGPADLGVADFIALAEVDIPSWPADRCRLCRTGVPVNTRFAHGAEFVAARRAGMAPAG